MALALLHQIPEPDAVSSLLSLHRRQISYPGGRTLDTGFVWCDSVTLRSCICVRFGPKRLPNPAFGVA